MAIRTWLSASKGIAENSNKKKVEYSEETYIEIHNLLLQDSKDEDNSELDAVISQLYKFATSENSNLEQFCFNFIPAFIFKIVTTSDLPSNYEALVLAVVNIKRPNPDDVVFPSFKDDISSIYHMSENNLIPKKSFKICYKQIEFKEKILAKEKDQICSSLVELFRIYLPSLESIARTNFIQLISQILRDNEPILIKYELFLCSSLQVLFQLNESKSIPVSSGSLALKNIKEIQRFASDELLTELLLVSNAMVSFFSASSSSCSGARGTSFLQTPDLRHCRGIKSGNLVKSFYDEERQGKRYLMI
ncbi:unnamed protein product [Oikopleura dioica]|uniref:Uncharacterized protein n=1 Tax=Oikopleura dioica TaxID=34765 RepID=E4YB99_OIKDI|nr:unnamed protein product [Oikopleura dioica]